MPSTPHCLTNICWRDNGKGGWDVDELRYLQLELTWRALGGKDGVVSVNHCSE